MDSKECDKMNANEKIPYIAFESVQARNERHIKRLIIVIIILISLLFASNMAWLAFMYGVDFESYDVVADGNSIANYVGEEMDGDINYGGSGKSEETDPQDGGEGQNNEETGQDG